MAHGVQPFNLALNHHSNSSGLIRGVKAILSVVQVVTGVAFWLRTYGTGKSVVIVGSNMGMGIEYLVSATPVMLPENVLVDASDLETLGLSQTPADVEINARRRHVEGSVSGFGSFLGSPYVFGNLNDARRCLGLGAEGTMFLLINVEPGQNASTVRDSLRRRTPELDVLSKVEFSNRARRYWTIQTGAGGALLTAALLGFVVGVLIVSQTVYATTMENVEEFATLKALGASRYFIVRIVVAQSLISALLGFAVGILAAIPIISIARNVISWIYMPWELPAVVAPTTVILAALASVTAVRAAISIEPGRVFRA